MYKIKKMFKNFRIVLAFIFIVLAIVAINPAPWADGVAIRNVVKNSSASIGGIENPKPNAPPRSREILTSINNRKISDVEEYYEFVKTLEVNRTIQVKTNKGTYKLITKPEYDMIYLNGTEIKMVDELQEYNETVNGTLVLVNKTVKKQVTVQKTELKFKGVEDIGLRVYDAPTNNIRKGLDLQGGTRVLLKPEEEIERSEMEILLSNMKERLNVYGLSDVTVRETSDLSGNQYVLVEIAGANEEDVRELLSKQGKFEAKVANTTVFKGGGDITYVCRSAECSGIDPQQGCGISSDGSWVCRFRFSISLTPEAAQRQAATTVNLDIITEDGEQYLSEKIYLFLDNSLVDSLNIGAELKGRPVTDISIAGAGAGRTREEATYDALNNMKRLQTILITGSLPVKMEIIETNNISPTLGDEFTKNAIFMGTIAILAVAVVVFFRYRKLQIALPMVVTMSFEVILLLGLAALVGWNLDLAAIAGIIVAAGTGVDDQIVIADEILKGEADVSSGWKQKMKRAFFIIMGSYLTVVVAMIPLLFAGAGMLKGFAFTTIAGVSFGVFITRPAYAAMAEILLKK
ncbi:hypothetical protein COV19_07205 [Candidatus Woesearchaeota archaeon CG10_big_fil_rev_8_21_14_0_10_44_13]|nr:MAG: hypothetical protein COV19_07205 [Candidatus Woesearchaeota archaeon CG10_big_fil_rev_8_21_14_0_10_44_13]